MKNNIKRISTVPALWLIQRLNADLAGIGARALRDCKYPGNIHPSPPPRGAATHLTDPPRHPVGGLFGVLFS